MIRQDRLFMIVMCALVINAIGMVILFTGNIFFGYITIILNFFFLRGLLNEM